MRHSDATKAKLSKARRGKNNPFHGKKHTEEAKRKIAEASRNRKGRLQPQRQSVVVPEPDTWAWGYFCGLLDGEGSIRFRKCSDGHKRPFIAIYNSDREIMLWLEDNLKGNVVWESDKRGRVPCHTWHVGGARDVAVLCRAAIPMLKAKRADAEEAINHLIARYGEEVLLGDNGH